MSEHGNMTIEAMQKNLSEHVCMCHSMHIEVVGQLYFRSWFLPSALFETLSLTDAYIKLADQ